MKRFKNFEIEDLTWYHILDYRDKFYSKYAKLPKTSEMTKDQLISLFNDMVNYEMNSIKDVEEPKMIYFHLIPGVANQINDFLMSQHITDWNIHEYCDEWRKPECLSFDGIEIIQYNLDKCIFLEYRMEELIDYGLTTWEANNKNNYNPDNNGKK